MTANTKLINDAVDGETWYLNDEWAFECMDGSYNLLHWGTDCVDIINKKELLKIAKQIDAGVFKFEQK